MKKLIKNANIVTEADMYKADVLIDGETIECVGVDIECADSEIIDASGRLLLPGAVDVHTHMDLDVGFTRACDDWTSGTIAAACGGTTTVVDHMAFAPGDAALMHQVDTYHALADGHAVIDYGFHGVLQLMNDSKLEEMKQIARREGITSWKAYMTYGDNMIDDEWLFKILKTAADEGLVIPAHCENDALVELTKAELGALGKLQAKYHPLARPADAEAEAVSRLLHIAKAAGEAAAYVVHLSSEAGLKEVIKVRESGQKHFGVETCTQYLALTDEAYSDDQEGLKAIMSPPLRKKADNDALWAALARDGMIDVVATDHCPFTFKEQKQMGKDDFRKCPNGAPGVEERLPIMYSEGVSKGRISLPQLVKYCCTEPARIFGLYPKKGAIIPGADADIVVFNPEAKHILTIDDMHGANDYTCYEGFNLTGRIEKVFARGNLIVEDNVFLGSKGAGRYLRRGISSLI
ncbi:MAG: dihydropyrimidinase [Mogibacterium sp.]|nr:dihydropyrimidinase [Mogibacterium sp.]